MKEKDVGKACVFCPDCGIAIEPTKRRCSACVDKILDRKGWDGNTCDLPTTNASVRVPSTVIEKAKVHIQSIDSLSQKV